MFNVYITYFKNSDGTINSSSSETLMFTIPRSSGDFPVSNPRVKASEDSADSFDFSLERNSPYFDSLIKLKTRLRVVYDGDTIFYGRVLTVSETSFLKTKNVHCEGILSVLNDTFYQGLPSKNIKKITWSEYYNRIFQNHNTQIQGVDSWKTITRGIVDFTPVNETRKFEPSSWSQTYSLFTGLTSTFGGHIRSRYSSGINYVDWYKYYWRDLGNNRPFVEIGKNILDITSDNKIDNVATRIIPIGDSDHNGNPIYIDGYVYTDKNGQQHTHSTKYISLTLLCDLFTQQQLNDEFHSYSDYEQAENDYGLIYKTQNFSDANTKEKLWNYVIDWIKKGYFGIANSFTVKAVDIHVVNNAYPKILCGECVDVKFFRIQNGVKVWETRKLICKSVQYDLFKPENTSYVFGVPADLLSHNYTEQKKKQDQNYAGGGKKTPTGEDEDPPITFRSIAELIGVNGTDPPYYGTDARNSFLTNGELSGTAMLYDPEETQDPITDTDKCFKVQVVGKITLSGYSDIFVAVSDKGICAFKVTSHSWGYFPAPVDLWYTKKNNTKYVPTSSVVTQASATTGTVAGLGILAGSTIVKAVGTGLVGIGLGATGTLADLLKQGLDGIDPKLTIDSQTGDTLLDGSDAGLRVKNTVANKVAVAIKGMTSSINVNDTIHDKLAAAINGNSGIFKLRNTTADKDSVVVDGSNSKLDVRNTTEDKDSVEIDGLAEKLMVGIKGLGFRIKINEPTSYTDEEGTSHSNVRGFVIADDLKLLDDDSLRSVDSFKSDRIVTKELIAGKATIGELNAEKARVNTLLTNYVLSSYLEANFVKADAIDTNRILISKTLAVGTTGSLVNLYNGTVQANTVQVNSGGQLRLVGSQGGEYYDLTATNIQGFIKSASVDPSTNTLTLTPVHGDPITFRKASTITLTGSWGSATGSKNLYTVTAKNSLNEVVATHQIRVDTQFSAGNGLFAVGTYQTNLQQPTSVQETFTTYKLGLNGTDVEIQYNSNSKKISNTPTYSIATDLAAAKIVGWQNAYGKVVLPSENTTSAFATVKTPASLPTGGTNGQNTTNLYITSDDTYAYIRSGSSTGTIVAKSSIAGWTAAYNKVELPAAGTGDSIVVKTPASTSSGGTSGQNSTTYTLSNDGDNTVQLKTGSTVVAKFAHNKYNAGRNAVTITKGSWSSGQITFTKSAGTASTKGVKVGLDGSWGTGDNVNKYSYTIKDYYDNNQGVSTGYTGTVDATSKYNAGVTQGWTNAYNKVSLPAAGTTASMVVKTPASTSSGGTSGQNSTTYTISNDGNNAVQLKTGSTVVAKFTHSKYDSGVTQGWTNAYNKVVIPSSANTSSTFMTVKTPASTSSGGTSGQNSTKFYVTSDNSNVYIRNGSSTGTIVAQGTNGAYGNGWTAAYNKVSIPSSTNTTSYMTVKTPASTSTGGTSGQNSTTFYIDSTEFNIYIRKDSTTGTAVAWKDNSSVLYAGWDAAYGMVEIPTSSSTGYAMRVRSPSSAYGGQDTNWYYVDSDNNYAYIRYGSSSGTIVARDTNKKSGGGGGGSITPSTDISINNPSWYNSGSSMPSVDATLSTMGSLIAKGKLGYVYFNVTISGVSGKKVYRIPVDTR